MAQTHENDYVDARLDDVKAWDGGYNPPAPGDYRFEVTKAERALAKSSGNPMLVATCEVVGDIDGNPTDEDGKTVIKRYVEVGGPARARLKCFLEAIDALDKRNGYSVSSCLGKQFIASITMRNYEQTDNESGEKTQRSSAELNRERPILDASAAVEDDLPPEEVEEPPPPPVKASAKKSASKPVGKPDFVQRRK